MKIVVHADDFGVSRGVTNNILRCVDSGPIRSTSIIVNGKAFDYAVEEYRKRADLKLVCHLNLIEGRPITPPAQLDLLTDKDGFFYHSFTSLWKAHLFGTIATRNRLEVQVRTEVGAQIEQLRLALGDDSPVAIDGHNHTHLIPFVFKAILDLTPERPVSYIRLMREPFFIGMKGLLNCPPRNLIVHILLNSLSKRYRHALNVRGIDYPDYFVGLLFTCEMSVPIVELALNRLRSIPADALVEVLFHPGGARAEEKKIWARYPGYEQFYFSRWRALESESVRSEAFKSCLQHFQGGVGGGGT